MEKIQYKGKKGYFLPEEAKQLLDETIKSFKDYRESTKSLSQIREVKV